MMNDKTVTNKIDKIIINKLFLPQLVTTMLSQIYTYIKIPFIMNIYIYRSVSTCGERFKNRQLIN